MTMLETRNQDETKEIPVFTSRYANHELDSGEYTAVSISRGNPRFRIGYTIEGKIWELAPSKEIFHLEGKLFDEGYRKQLDEIGLEKVQQLIQQFYVGKPVVLLCFEDIRNPDTPCHRTDLASWLKDNGGIVLEELPDPSEDKWKKSSKKGRQLNLFSI